MEGGIYMNKNEQVEYQLLEDFREGRKTRKQVALLLGISESSVSRRIRKIREQGISGIKHGNYSRAPLNKISFEIRDHLKVGCLESLLTWKVREKYSVGGHANRWFLALVFQMP
jgi:DNA-binding Lrp family transcriptional regulator